MIKYLLLGTSISLAILGQLLMKRGMQIFGTFPVSQLLQNLIPMIFSPFVFLGLAAFAVSSVFWLVILSRFELSLVYPMVSTAYVAVALLSWAFLGETVSLIRWLGILVICFGVVLISRS